MKTTDFVPPKAWHGTFFPFVAASVDFVSISFCLIFRKTPPNETTRTGFNGPFPGGRIAWGNCRVWISPSSVIVQNPETDETVIRSNLSIHGGTVPGSAGCIDLTNNADSFFNLLVHSNSDRIRLNVNYSRPGFR